MSAQASGAIVIKGRKGVIGGSRDLKGLGRGALQGHGGLESGVEAVDLADLARRLGGSGCGLPFSHGGPSLGPLEPLSVEVERIPAKAEPAQHHGGRREHAHSDDQPPHGRQGREKRGPHGNTFRSSSKCGPSRRRGQSPPQTRATPLAFAAALMASAMRG